MSITDEKPKLIFVENSDGRYEVTYPNGHTLKTSAFLILVDHSPDFSLISEGNSTQLGNLIFGMYNTLIKEGANDPERAEFAHLIEMIATDIARCAKCRDQKDPESLLAELSASGDGTSH